MNDDNTSTVALPVAKVISVWAALGITSWADVASILAAGYTLLLITEWFWKKFWRPMLERAGKLQPLKRRRSVDSETGGL